MKGHINGTGNKVQGRDDTASKGNKDVGPDAADKPKLKGKKKPAAAIAAKIKGLK
jgi:hypothetical protein